MENIFLENAIKQRKYCIYVDSKGSEASLLSCLSKGASQINWVDFLNLFVEVLAYTLSCGPEYCETCMLISGT